MAVTIDPVKREKLFTQLRHMLGAPLRGVELEDAMLDTALELSILDYGEFIDQEYYIVYKKFTSNEVLFDGSINTSEMYKVLSQGYQTEKLEEKVISNLKGNLPSSIEELKKLPGIGDYTSQAISAIVFNKPIIPPTAASGPTWPITKPTELKTKDPNIV